jgi:uncharacterized RDD family membrane protein YckC
MTHPGVPYAGIATRAVALAVDAAMVNAIVLTGGAVLALIASLVSDAQLDTLGKALAAAAWMIVVASYFVLFWSTTGQTPGMRLMRLQVVTGLGARLGVIRSIVRVIGLGLAIIPLFLGFLPVFVDARRRGLHDFLAGTVVCYDDAALDEIVSTAAAVELDPELERDDLVGQPVSLRNPRPSA